MLPAWWLKPGSSEMVKLGMLAKWVLQVGSEQGMPRYFYILVIFAFKRSFSICCTLLLFVF